MVEKIIFWCACLQSLRSGTNWSNLSYWTNNTAGLDWNSCTFFQLTSEVALCIENQNFIDRFIDRITRKRNQDINQVDNSSKSIDSEKLNNNAIRRNEHVIIVNLVYHNQTVFIKGIIIWKKKSFVWNV